ncbi:MAG: TlpA disulfide reductase family protein, partial [Anaerolineae bacterium]|nr:TlpA disulfide reductase family protein [Anaerolineae bacterium]
MTSNRLTLKKAILRINLTLSLIFLIGGGVLLYLTAHRSVGDRPAVGGQQTTLSGQPAPDFALPALTGETVSLSDHLGQVVIINLWASWCEPCKAEMPTLNAFYQANRADGLVVLAINNQEDAPVVKAYLAENNLSLPVLLDAQAEMLDRYQVP